MTDIPITTLMALFGFAGGSILGFTARMTRFCTLGAIEDATITGDFRRLRAWGLAIAIALVGTQFLQFFEIIDLTNSIHLRPELTWASLSVGSLCFGFGMAKVGTCPYGALVRLGTGDMRALVTLLIIGITGYMTMSGLLAYPRVFLLDQAQYDFAQTGAQSIPSLTGLSDPTSHLMVALFLATILLFWIFKHSDFRASKISILAGIVIGLTICGGWFVTGLIGNDDFNPQNLVSFGFVSSVSNAVIYLMTYSGATIDFSIATVGGVIAGSVFGSVLKREFKLEAFDDAREMRRYLLGAAMMGFGGITALGCTLGQGITGLSTLSIGSIIATMGIIAGAIVGLHHLLEDDWKYTFLTIFRIR